MTQLVLSSLLSKLMLGSVQKSPTKAPPRGALDNQDHWWLPPSHVRADLRNYLPSSSWHRIVLLSTFVQFTFVLSELVATILEPIYPPSTNEEKYFYGVVLLAADTMGGVVLMFLVFELWIWMLAFGVGWWRNISNVVEVLVLVLDFGLRMLYSGPIEVARCLHLIVRALQYGTDWQILLKILVRVGKYSDAVSMETRVETVKLIKELDKNK